MYLRRGKTGVSSQKPLGAKKRTKNKLNPHMAATPGFEPRPDWWEASVLKCSQSYLYYLHVLCNLLFFVLRSAPSLWTGI